MQYVVKGVLNFSTANQRNAQRTQTKNTIGNVTVRVDAVLGENSWSFILEAPDMTRLQQFRDALKNVNNITEGSRVQLHECYNDESAACVVTEEWLYTNGAWVIS